MECPFCKSEVKLGATVCAACGATEKRLPNFIGGVAVLILGIGSFAWICAVFPLLLWIMATPFLWAVVGAAVWIVGLGVIVLLFRLTKKAFFNKAWVRRKPKNT